MEGDRYVYRIRPLVIPGLVFMAVYPLITGLIYLVTRFSAVEVYLLTGIYIVTIICFFGFWIFGRSKSVGFTNHEIVFQSLMGSRVLEPSDIKKVVVFLMPNGKEVAQIRTSDNSYYLSDLYFPFPELMSDLENFARENNLKLVEVAKTA
ncbi:MAG: hypothetical protein M0T74_05810 [Desulfitobacterium hafniense]|nr:hypothetical protein [Desulfitobacterium hafniense]